MNRGHFISLKWEQSEAALTTVDEEDIWPLFNESMKKWKKKDVPQLKSE